VVEWTFRVVVAVGLLWAWRWAVGWKDDILTGWLDGGGGWTERERDGSAGRRPSVDEWLMC
jgi:hypothetical protein